MEDELYSKRFSNLESSVKKALKQMQTDGLARQLELHRTSSIFAPKRLLEVLSDNIEASREKFIQQLLHEIDNSVFERDKVELKNQKLKTQILANSKAAKEENQKLKQRGIKISEMISEIQQKQTHREARFEKALSIRDNEIRKSNSLFSKTKSILRDLSSELSELRLQVSMYSTNSQRSLKSTCNKIKVESKHRLADVIESQEVKMTTSISSKKTEAETAKRKTASLQHAYNGIINYLNENAAAVSLSSRITNVHDIDSVVAQILEAKADESVKLHLKQASTQISSLNQDRKNYANSAARYVNEILRKKEKELDAIIAQARQRRHKLKADLAAAQEQIKALTGSKMSGEGDSMKEFEKSNTELESATQMLDMTMSQLGLGPETRKSKV
ncbi:hypothetical protein TRFO_07009 [Tritrichomonas foetus]|uniref:Uncharacterized protein n=1 Tax=Tritrichomonas foetus TaxID=1144522 RepID=A0A1J4JVY6_9EUKA|nr:hypothetical protein TRFO_07009 [Tritrichomonas foetus]|eukprot:OHT02600.1 hypothetical protein TRFO_07009 [Tritrichomonas foetus]